MKRASITSCCSKYISKYYKWAKRDIANVMFQNTECNKIKERKGKFTNTTKGPPSWAQSYKLLFTSQIYTNFIFCLELFTYGTKRRLS